jgi:hypothetical protein
MYINGKLIPIETVPGMVGEIKESGGGRKIKLIYCKNFL